jgi:hypothetical protein
LIFAAGADQEPVSSDIDGALAALVRRRKLAGRAVTSNVTESRTVVLDGPPEEGNLNEWIAEGQIGQQAPGETMGYQVVHGDDAVTSRCIVGIASQHDVDRVAQILERDGLVPLAVQTLPFALAAAFAAHGDVVDRCLAIVLSVEDQILGTVAYRGAMLETIGPVHSEDGIPDMILELCTRAEHAGVLLHEVWLLGCRIESILGGVPVRTDPSFALRRQECVFNGLTRAAFAPAVGLAMLQLFPGLGRINLLGEDASQVARVSRERRLLRRSAGFFASAVIIPLIILLAANWALGSVLQSTGEKLTAHMAGAEEIGRLESDVDRLRDDLASALSVRSSTSSFSLYASQLAGSVSDDVILTRLSLARDTASYVARAVGAAKTEEAVAEMLGSLQGVSGWYHAHRASLKQAARTAREVPSAYRVEFVINAVSGE